MPCRFQILWELCVVLLLTAEESREVSRELERFWEKSPEKFEVVR